MADTTVKCKECGTEFEISESEQAFYTKKSLQLPKRCKPCRELRKKEAQSEGSRGSRS